MLGEGEIAAEGPRTGDDAVAPTAIPLAGWRDIAVRTALAAMRHEAPTIAASIGFYGLLAFIPALSAAASLYVLFADAPAGARQLSALFGVAPDAALELAVAELRRLSAQSADERFWIAAGSTVAVIGSVNAAVMALLFGLNVAYEEEEGRSFLKRSLIAAGFTAGILVLAPSTFAALLVGRSLAGSMPAPAMAQSALRLAFLAVEITVALAILYRYGPCRRLARWRWVTPGGVLAAVVWLASSSALSFYLVHFAHYERTYGVLGAVLAVMAWLWTGAVVVLLGAELNAQVEAQTERDTTA